MSSLRHKTIQTSHGEIRTPAFLPDATYGSVHSLSWDDLLDSGINEIVTNTLHLELKLGSSYIEEYGGLHKFFGWDRPILTDSGGFQVFSLMHRRANKNNYINDNAAHFKDPKTGTVHVLSPESSQQIQYKLDSDIRVVLDEPLAFGATKEKNLESVKRTTEWAKRSKKEFLRLHGLSEEDFSNPEIDRPILGAVIQGSDDYELRKRSAMELMEIDFDSYNFGGLPIKDDGMLDLELAHFLAELLPEDKIRYAMGIGTPDDIIKLAHMGWDLFDCVLPTRNARHGTLYVPKGQGDQDFENYSVIHIRSERYKNLHTHPALKNISPAYLRHLIRIGEPAGFRYAIMHNLRFYAEVIGKVRRPQ
ncbi:MAG: tRNA-guanine transglycosylase [Candidatus Dojkabacteria bacterium]